MQTFEKKFKHFQTINIAEKGTKLLVFEPKRKEQISSFSNQRNLFKNVVYGDFDCRSFHTIFMFNFDIEYRNMSVLIVLLSNPVLSGL